MNKLLPYDRSTWSVRPPPAHKYEDLFNPDYWVNQLQDGQYRVGDYIDVLWQDMSAHCVLVIAEIDENRMWMKVRLAKEWNEQVQEDKSEMKDDDGFRVEWAGPHDKWRVMSPMGIKVASGYASKADAERALADIKAKKAA